MIAYVISGLTGSPHFLLPIIREKKKSSLQVRNVPHQKKSGNRRVKAGHYKSRGEEVPGFRKRLNHS